LLVMVSIEYSKYKGMIFFKIFDFLIFRIIIFAEKKYDGFQTMDM